MEKGLIRLPDNHATALSNMHPMAVELMRAKYEGNNVSELLKEDMIPAVRSAIQDCLKSLGHTKLLLEEDKIEHDTMEMCRYFLTTYKTVTIQEFRLILKNMINGDYKIKPDEIIVCTVQSMCAAIKGYLGSALFKMAFADYHNRLKLDKAPEEKTPEEIRKIMIFGTLSAFNEFKTFGTLPGAVSGIYDFVKKEKDIKWTKIDGAKIKKQAEEAYKINQAEGGSFMVKEVLENKEAAILIECKRICLKLYFKSITELKFEN